MSEDLTTEEESALMQVAQVLFGAEWADSTHTHIDALVQKGYLVRLPPAEGGGVAITRKGIDLIADDGECDHAKQPDTVKFSDLLDHPTLYLMCPSLAEMPVRLIAGQRLDNGDLTAYRKDAGGEWIDVARDAPRDDLRAALLGEAQRAVNRMESWE